MSSVAARRANLRLVPGGIPTAAGSPVKDRESATALGATAILIEDALRAGDTATLVAECHRIADDGMAAKCAPAALRGLPEVEQRAALRLATALAGAVDLLSGSSTKAAKAALRHLRTGFGETGLMLSGGGKLGNYHIGVVRLLLAENILPRIISGSSAGSLIAALIGTRTEAALRDLMADEAHALAELGEADLDSEMFTALTQNALRKTVARLIPDWTFAEARAYSGRAINIAAAGNADDGTGTIFNAETTPYALVRDAVMASCAVPYIYAPVQIGERLPDGTERGYANGEYWMDGSVDADMPAAWLRAHYGVTRLIASVVNPFELPMLTDPDHHGPFLHAAASFTVNIVRTFWSTTLAMAMPVMRHVPIGGRVIALSKRVLDQRIDADVIIAPNQRVHDFTKLLQHATLSQLSSFVAEGERATKARMVLIAPSLRIEAALMRAAG